jgi:histidinol dehydrogenase
LHPGIAYAAQKCGIDNIYAVGGAHAIAAMAYGTDTIPRAQKIFGPGNSWVTEAKQQVAFDPRGAAIDMPAGPSEVLVIADKNARPDFVAIDLLSQAEHGPDSQAIVLSDDATLLDNVAAELARQLQGLSRQDILEQSQQHIRLILVDDLDQALQLSNDYAPEHLILQTENADNLANDVVNAGSVFIGSWAPESLGDYCSGTNHVLPTYGFARSYNGLSMMDFMQKITFQKVTPQGIQNIGPCAVTLADAEGLDAHKAAVEIRLQAVREGQSS